MKLATQQCAYDPFDWPGTARTMRVAHQYIEQHWNDLENEAVVDVEFILGETYICKRSERDEAAFA